MPAVGLLHHVHRQESNRIDALLFEFDRHDYCLLECMERELRTRIIWPLCPYQYSTQLPTPLQISVDLPRQRREVCRFKRPIWVQHEDGDIVKSGVWLVCSMKRQAASFC